MPLAAADLLQPTGRVAPSFFPDDDAAALSARLGAYLSEAYAAERVAALPAGVGRDDAARQYAYMRAFEAISDRVNLEAASITLGDQGARSRIAEQIRFWRTERDHAAARFDALAPPLDASVTPRRQGSASVPITFRY